MSAHVEGCVYSEIQKKWTIRGEGCAAPEEHEQAPEERVMTMDDARSVVAMAVVGTMKKSIEQFEQMATDTEQARLNKASLIAAAVELHNTLLIQARKFQRPAILRPQRSRGKVVRG